MMIGVATLTSLLLLGYVQGTALSSESELKQFCLIFALPGRSNGSNIPEFETTFNAQLEIAGKKLFDPTFSHADRIKQTSKCSAMTPATQYTSQCAYHRLSTIKTYFVEDLNRLQAVVPSSFTVVDASELFINYLGAWFLDNVFLALNCGAVDFTKLKPTVQHKIVAIWSRLLTSRDKFCTFAKPLSKTVAVRMRHEFSELCARRSTDAVCEMRKMFDLTDKVEDFCKLVPSASWGLTTGYTPLYKKAIMVNFYTIRQDASPEIASTFDPITTDSNINVYLADIIEKLFRDFIEFKRQEVVNMLKVVPEGNYLPCDFTVKFPEFKWLLCTCAKTFTNLRVFLYTYEDNKGAINTKKLIVSDFNYRSYIMNLHSKQIQELQEMYSLSLERAVTAIKANQNQRFQELGQYFTRVAAMEKSKLNKDVEYLNGTITSLNKRLTTKTQSLASNLQVIMQVNMAAKVLDLAEALVKLALRVIAATNPFGWLTGSNGSPQELMESATEISTKAKEIAEAIGFFIKFQGLFNAQMDIINKLNKNQAPLRNVKKILDGIKSETESKDFQNDVADFLKQYGDYTPQVTAEDIVRLTAHWDGFIDAVCDALDNSESTGANIARTVGTTDKRCREVKGQAVAVVTILEEIYKFELMETMAKMMHSWVRIHEAKKLGTTATESASSTSLADKDITRMTQISGLSFAILQTTNVYKYCDILTYTRGRKPKICTGMSTNVLKLLSLRPPIYYQEFKFVNIPTKPAADKDLAFIDLKRLYEGEEIDFQIPNADWMVANKFIRESEKYFVFYLHELELFFPVTSTNALTIHVKVTPTNYGNKLNPTDTVEYLVKPQIVLNEEFSVGNADSCRGNLIDNPYGRCGATVRGDMTKICENNIPVKTLFSGVPYIASSIFSKFKIKVNGLKNYKLDIPSGDFKLKAAIKLAYVDLQNLHDRRRDVSMSNGTDYRRSIKPKVQMSKRGRYGKPKSAGDQRYRRSATCCPQTNQYFSSSADCLSCATGTTSYHNNLFCGKVLKLLNKKESIPSNLVTMTAAEASDVCKAEGTVIATVDMRQKARDAGQKSCDCGWLSDGTYTTIDATGCAACPTNKKVAVWCARKYKI